MLWTVRMPLPAPLPPPPLCQMSRTGLGERIPRQSTIVVTTLTEMTTLSIAFVVALRLVRRGLLSNMQGKQQ